VTRAASERGDRLSLTKPRRYAGSDHVPCTPVAIGTIKGVRMRTAKYTKVAAAVAALALLVAGCGSDDDGDDTTPTNTSTTSSTQETTGNEQVNETLKLGYVLPETGDLAFLGPPQIQAMNYAISLI